ncbi:hypothetical protein ACIQUM_33920 [Amycolatopsis azurea]|uniref:hypothetical protein n=1 Tax=Amycolatopsis azurea TaxID=36819 RepID=UPI0038249A03
MTTVPVATGEPPEKPSPNLVTPTPESGFVAPLGAPQYVSFDELLDAAAEPSPEVNEAAVVLQPPCRAHSHGWLRMADRVTSGEWKHTWQAAVLLVVLGIVASGVLLAGSVLLRAAALSAMALGGLLWLSRRNASQAQQA